MKSLRYKKLRIFIYAAFFIFLVSISWGVYTFFKTPLANGEKTPLIIALDKSTTATQFAQLLKDRKIIHSSNFFLSIIKLQGLSHQLKAGVYQIKPYETAYQFLHRVVAGDVIVQNFKIIAGTTQNKITQELMHTDYLTYDSQAWENIQGNHANAEGLLLADTYQYPGGSSAHALLEHAHRNLMAYLMSSWDGRDENLPYKTPYELLIAASIIEKESAHSEDRRLISGVMVNRLKKGMPLQMDPTVIYGMGNEYQGKLVHNDLLIDSPYNTYRNKGLPPTPIAVVGKNAIEAAAHPTFSNYLYFVAKGDGTHQFSETYVEQKQAIIRYQHKDS